MNLGNLDFKADVKITYKQLMNGEEIIVNTPQGKRIAYTLKPDMLLDKIYRIKGQGYRRTGYNGNDEVGDLYIQFILENSSVANKPMNFSENKSSPTTLSSELDHDALKIYLHDILALECIKNKYIEEIDIINYQLSSISQTIYKKEYALDLDLHTTLYFMYKDGQHYLGISNDKATTNFPPHDYKNIDVNLNSFTELSLWLELGRISDFDLFARRKQAKRRREAFFHYYEIFKNEAAHGLQNNISKAKNLKIYKNGISQELFAVENMLKKAYDMNIIPAQFRYNFYTIYYLYEFISTSNLSLSTAMLHFDLNEIKIKLDNIIAQQQELIIQQSIIMAQNQQQLEYNQIYLKKLANIEHNTAQSAKYSQIAANNAEACAWINLANYIKK